MKVIALVCILFSTILHAETYDLKERFGVGVSAGYGIPVLSREFNEIANPDLTLGLNIRYQTSMADALLLNFQNYNFEETDIGASVYDLMWISRINEVDKLTPIIGIGAGVADMKNIAPYKDNYKFAGRLRLGFEYMLNPDVMLAFITDYQYIGRMPSTGEDDGINRNKVPGQEIHAVVPQLQLTVFFGPDKEKNESDPAPAVAPVTDPSMMDSDKDGITDDKDKCPGTDPGITVNAVGCTPGKKTVN